MDKTLNLEVIKFRYPDVSRLYEKLGSKVTDIIRSMISTEGVKSHAIYHRVKELKSLIDKIESKDKYSKLEDITDLCGVRIITYLASDVDSIVKIIRDKFVIDEINSIDKRKKDAKEFGYKSVHLVVSLPDNWIGSPIDQELKGLKVELQIRSILEHAWAEIEHDLGYKSDSAVPYPLQRGFTRLAANLESADFEFDRLKNMKKEYEQEVVDSIDPTSVVPVSVNPISLSVFANSNSTFNEIRDELTKERGMKYARGNKNFDKIIEKLSYLKINTINELEVVINANKEPFKRFVRLLFERRKDSREVILHESPLEYLLHYIAASKGREYLNKYKVYGTNSPEGNVKEITDFLDLYRDAHSNN
ncbi:GTP pyrophosphokinase [Chitinophaga niabensis]|uniref:PpGpp synthetase catalytic domain-containing protein (RelA/SpoT-type nucleotidyltranferase) n=1 Tax=Chitinophaga niabensis TaxID=536979 RepID=A0A1N6FJ57_9BACT|nr:hypothetical protein [Chitinophaga niabensis]SIN95309.1 ppGpp synthetase catalytic domain-containing protein (RelA/SpoT-type nucleotidyltranferase) [Chitinophaga niabensis]